jgi:hypothetical protein
LRLNNIECFIATDPTITCGNYIKVREQQGLECTRDVFYDSRIKNVGNKCIQIEKVKYEIDGVTYNINVNKWNPDKLEFCDGEKMILRRKVLDVNLCNYANQDIDFVVRVKDEDGPFLKAEGSIEFPGPNTVTTIAPTKSPSLIPSLSFIPSLIPSPDQASGCTSKPDTITFKLRRKTCNESSHSQALQRIRRMKRKGKGNIKEPCARCHKCEDVNDSCEIKTMDPLPIVTITNKDTKDVLWSGCVDFVNDFVFKLDSGETMPDCIEITIQNHDPKSKYADIAQIVSFKTTCTPDAPLSIGDIFGGVEIVSFN